MAIVKSFTDLEQSEKLVKILPLESADMRIGNYVGKSGKVDGTNVHYYHKDESFGAPEIINAWSLAALLGVLPSGYAIVKNYHGFYFVESRDHGKSTNIFNNPIDACYEMILKLHELKML